MSTYEEMNMSAEDYSIFDWVGALEITDETIVMKKPNSVLFDRTLLTLDSEFDLSTDPFKIRCSKAVCNVLHYFNSNVNKEQYSNSLFLKRRLVPGRFAAILYHNLRKKQRKYKEQHDRIIQDRVIDEEIQAYLDSIIKKQQYMQYMRNTCTQFYPLVSSVNQTEMHFSISRSRHARIVLNMLYAEKEVDYWTHIRDFDYEASTKLIDCTMNPETNLAGYFEFMEEQSKILDFCHDVTTKFNRLTFGNIVKQMTKEELDTPGNYMHVSRCIVNRLANLEVVTEYTPNLTLKRSRYYRKRLIEQCKQIGVMNPELVKGLIGDISLRVVKEYVDRKPIYRSYVVIDNDVCISTHDLLRKDCYANELMKTLAQSLLRRPEVLQTRSLDLAYLAKGRDKLQAGEKYNDIINVLTTQLMERFSGISSKIRKLGWARIALDIYNIITNIISIWRGDTTIRVMNVIGLLMNITSLIATLCLQLAIDYDKILNTTITNLFYKWFVFLIETDPSVNEIIDDDTRENIKEAFKDIEIEESKQVPGWQKFKDALNKQATISEKLTSLLVDDENLEAKRSLIDIFQEHGVGDELLKIINADKYIEHVHVLKDNIRVLDLDFLDCITDPKLNDFDCECKTNCRCVLNALKESKNITYFNVGPKSKITLTDNNDQIITIFFKKNCYHGDARFDDTFYDIVDKIIAIPPYLDVNVLVQKIKPDVMQSVSISKWVHMGFTGVLTIVALGICFYANKQVDDKDKPLTLQNNFAASMIQFATLKNALKGCYSDVEEFSSNIIEACDNTINDAIEQRIAKALVLNDLLNRFLALTDVTFMETQGLFTKFNEAIETCSSFIVEKTEDKNNEQVNRAVQILLGTLVTAQQKIQVLAQTISSTFPKQATLLVWVYGNNGAGKSYYIRNRLNKILKDKFGYDEMFPISYGSQPEFFPDSYAGQQVGVFDEFNQSIEDPFFNLINVLDSNISINLPGAALNTKIRPSKFELVCLTSNSNVLKTSGRLTRWQPEALKAMHARMLKYKFENVMDNRASTMADREKVPHEEDYSHLKISRVYEDDGGAQLNDRPAEELSLEDFESQIIDEILARRRVYKDILESQGHIVDKIDVKNYDVKLILSKKLELSQEQQAVLQMRSKNYTVLLTGATDKGKTTSIEVLAKRLAQTCKMEVVTLSYSDLTTPGQPRVAAIVKPCVVVTNDAMGDELAYMEMWDRLPTSSIILNSSNMDIRKEPMRMRKIIEAWRFSPNYLTFFNKTMMNLAQDFHVIENEYADTTKTPKAGFARRTGLTGPVYHNGQVVMIPEICGKWYRKGDGFINYDIEGNVISEEHMYDDIYSGYLRYLKDGEEIVIQPQTTLDSTHAHVGEWPDVLIKAETPLELKKMLDSAFNLAKLYYKGAKFVKECKANGTPLNLDTFSKLEGKWVFVKDHVASAFNASIEAFRLPDEERYSSNEVCEFGRRTYQVLRNANPDFDVYVDTGLVQVAGKRGVILWTTPETFSEANLKFEYTKLSETHFKFENGLRSIKLPKRTIMLIYQQGIRTFYGSTEMSYNEQLALIQAINTVVSLKDFKVDRERLEMQELARNFILEKGEKYLSYWELFKMSKWFVAFKVVCGLLCAAAAIVAIWAAFSSMLPKKVSKEVIQVNNYYYELETTPSEVIVTADTMNNLSDPEVVDAIKDGARAYLQSYDVEKKNFVEKKIVVKRAELQYSRDFENRGDKSKVIVKRPDKLHTAFRVGPTKQVFNNPTLEAISTKIVRNIVSVTAGVTGVGAHAYGLGVYSHAVICNAHVIGNNKMNMIETDEGVYAAIVRFIDYKNDICMLEIQDKRCQRFKDIRNYFIERKDCSKVKDSVMFRPSTLNGENLINFINGTSSYDETYIVRADYEHNITTNVYQTVYFNQRLNRAMSGHCGLPYISTDKTLNSRCILGIHMSSVNQWATSTCITRDYLDIAIRSAKDEGMVDVLQGVNYATVDEYTYHDVEVTVNLEGQQVKINDFVIEDQLYKDVIEPSEVEVNLCPTLFNDSKWLTPVGVLNKGSCTYHNAKHGYERAPWSEVLENQVQMDNSVLVSNDPRITDKSELIKDKNGKESVLYTQLNYHNEPKPLTGPQMKRVKLCATILADEYKSIYGSEIPMLTHTEAINSVNDPSSEYFGCIPDLNKDASTGYYVSTFKKAPLKSAIFTNVASPQQKSFYKYNDTKAAKYVKDQVEAFLRIAIEDEKVLLDVGKASLKAEVLKEEKVSKGLSRVFSPRGLVSVIVERMVFGAFMGKIKEKRAIGFCQVGIDTQKDFTQLYQRFKKIGTKAICLDFKRWDKHILAYLIDQAFHVIYLCMKLETETLENDVYNKQLLNIITAISKTFTCELIFADNQLMFRTIGMPSGTVLTSVINSIINDLIFTTYIHTLAIVNPDEAQFILKADRVNYGDDMVIIVPPEVEMLFTAQSYSDFVEQVYSIESTSPAKDSSEKRLCPLNEIEFLSHKFVVAPENQNLVIPQLKINSVLKQLHFWKDINQREVKDGLEKVLEDACAHPSAVYNSIKKDCGRIVKFMKDNNLGDITPKMPSYSNMRNTVLHKIDPAYGSRTQVAKSIFDTFSTISERFDACKAETEQIKPLAIALKQSIKLPSENKLSDIAAIDLLVNDNSGDSKREDGGH